MCCLFRLTAIAVWVIDWSMCVVGFLILDKKTSFSPWNLCVTLVLNDFLNLLLLLSSCGMAGLLDFQLLTLGVLTQGTKHMQGKTIRLLTSRMIKI